MLKQIYNQTLPLISSYLIGRGLRAVFLDKEEEAGIAKTLVVAGVGSYLGYKCGEAYVAKYELDGEYD